MPIWSIRTILKPSSSTNRLVKIFIQVIQLLLGLHFLKETLFYIQILIFRIFTLHHSNNYKIEIAKADNCLDHCCLFVLQFYTVQ